MPTVFLTHPPETRRVWYGDKALAALREMVEVRLHDGDETLTGKRLIDMAQGCDIIVSDRLTPGGPDLLAQVDSLLAFVRCAMDINNIDVPAAAQHGVLVTQASPGWIDAVSELVLAHMINLARQIPAAVAAMSDGRRPEVPFGVQLARKRLGIIGYGNLGRRVAELGHVLGMRVSVFDPYVPVVAPYVERVDFGALLRESDFVVCLAIYNEETENMMNAVAFSQMKTTAFFVNAARGGLVDEDALVEALQTGRIAGAALDVGRGEDNVPTPKLSQLPNVQATPHIGGLVPDAITHQALETVEQVAQILKGQIPPGAVNRGDVLRLYHHDRANGSPR